MLINFLACGGLNDMFPHKLRCLNILSPVGIMICVDLGCGGLAGGSMSLEVGFEAPKPHNIPSSLFLCLLLAVLDVSAQHPVLASCLLLLFPFLVNRFY